MIMTKQELSQAMRDLRTEYAQRLTDYAHENYGSEYFVPKDNIHEGNLEIGFISGKWNNGTPMFHGLDIYYDNDNVFDNGWKCEMNVSAMGSFKINGDSRQAKYYRLVGMVVNDNGGFEEIIHEFYDKMHEMMRLMNKIWCEEEQAKRKATEEALEKQRIEVVNKFNNSDKSNYVVISKYKYTGKQWFTYRKKPVTILNDLFFATEHDAIEYTVKNATNMAYCQIIPITKLKIA